MIDDELYRRTAEDLLLKCLDSDQTKVAMGEVHEGICGTHQSAPKMKWLLRRAGFYLPSMISDCFKYYKGCEEYQWFGDLQLIPANRSEVGGWILLDKLILHFEKGITSCWLLRII